MKIDNTTTKEKDIFVYNTKTFISFKLSKLKEINVFSNSVRFNINGSLHDFSRVDDIIFINNNEIVINDDFFLNVYNILSKYE